MEDSKEQCAVVENSPSSSRNLNKPVPEEAVGNFIAGKRHMLVQDYKFAVQNLATACEMYADHYGELALDCAEVYFLYGKALFRLSQQQTGVLGDALNEGSNEDDESGNTSGEESKENESEKNSEEGEENDENEQENENEPSESTDSPQQILDESSTEAKEETSAAKEDSAEVKNSETHEDDKNNEVHEDSKNKKANEDDKSNKANEGDKSNEASEGDKANEETKDMAEQEKGDNEDRVSEEDDLELAWNTLETAKQIFKRQEGVQYQLKVAEILQLLAEISMESDNNQAAINDLKECLVIQQKHLKPDDRILAETYYQMGLAQMLDKQYSDARENFKTTMDILELRIQNLKNSKSPDEKDSFKNADIDKEIQDLESILGDIKEKVEDTEELIRNTKKELEDAFANGVLGLKPTQSAGESSTSKPVSNITHLLKRKKPEETGNEAEAKRLKTSPGVSNGESSVTVDTVSSSNSAS